MPSTELKELKELPGIPAPLDPLADLYILRYIDKASSAEIKSKYFRAIGDFKDIVFRCKTHCEQMGMRFVFLKPFLSDLREDEKKHLASY